MNYSEYFNYWQSVVLVGSAQDFLSNNEKPIVEAFSITGLRIESVWSGLTNPKAENRKAIVDRIEQILSFLDDTAIHPRIMSGLVRSLAASHVAINRNLFEEAKVRYLSIPPSAALKVPLCRGLDQSFASLLAEHASESQLEELISLINTQKLGESRGLLLLGLKRHISNPNALLVLESLQSDHLFGKEARKILVAYNKKQERREKRRSAVVEKIS